MLPVAPHAENNTPLTSLDSCIVPKTANLPNELFRRLSAKVIFGHANRRSRSHDTVFSAFTARGTDSILINNGMHKGVLSSL